MSSPAPISTSAPSPVRALVRQLDGTSMYRVTSLTLVGLALAAVGSAAVSGGLWASWWQIAGSCLVSVVANSAFSRLFGRLMHVPVQPDSAVITGLILGFILPPTLSGTDIATLVLANLAAAGAKLALVINERHLFNPAAFGAAFVTLTAPLTHMSVSTWWIGNSTLLPCVAICWCIIGYRMHAFGRIGGVALLTILPAFVGLLLHSPIDVWGSAAILILTSSPMWFMAVFLLTEPLTMRFSWAWKWGVLAIIAIILLGNVVPLVSVPTELAILVGNSVVFVLNRQGLPRVTARIGPPKYLSKDIVQWTVTPAKPLEFVPGQFVELDLPQVTDRRGRRRVFSIVGIPRAPTFDIVVRISPQLSAFKRQLLSASTDQPIRVLGVGGEFTLPRDATTPVLLLAHGIGVTPMVSHVRAAVTAVPRPIELVWVVREASDIVFDDLGAADVTIIAPEHDVDEIRAQVPESWTVTAEPLAVVLGRSGTPHSAPAYVSGSPRNVRAMSTALREAGFKRIRRDQFTGY